MLNWLREKFFKHSSSGSRDSRDLTNHPGSSNNRPSSSLKSTMINLETTNRDDKITLIIINGGEVWKLDVYTNQTVCDLINMAISHFFDPEESPFLSSRYKFISVKEKKILNPQCTVRDEKLENNDELLLVKVISTVVATPKKLQVKDIKGPSQEEISNATADLISRNPVHVIPTLDCQDNFQSEIRKVLYSLVEASAKILATTPDAALVFDGIATRINSKMKLKIDKNAVKYLKDMGFSEAQARYALRLKRNRQIESMEWLLENCHRVKDIVDEQIDKPVASTSDSDRVNDPVQIITELLHDIREFHRRYFDASQRALDNLVAMGFDKDDAVEALRITDNNQVAACEWLCGERGPAVINPSVSLDVDSQLYKALMKNPGIQMGLQNPKVLLAFLSILENASSANLWLNDVDTAPVLGQIFKIYHSEKHIMVVNQQVEMMKKCTHS